MDMLLHVEQQVLWTARLAGALSLLWLVTLVLVAVCHRRSPDRAVEVLRRLGAPTLLCRTLLIVVCVGATQPAYATPSADGAAHRTASTPPDLSAETALARAIDGLPSTALPAPGRPFRAAPAEHTSRSACTYRVRPGESLWSIAEQHLSPAEHRLAALDRGWRDLYDENRRVIGDDPDLLAVDTRLDVTSLDPGCARG